jgi:hypothetical protein
MQDAVQLLQEAEELRRRWFRQLQAIEGDQRWHQGWQRLEELRSITQRIAAALERDAEQEAADLLEQLRRILREAQ